MVQLKVSGIHLYNDFRGQIKKLAAIYAFQNGMDAAAAAKRATAEVLDFKYDYRDGYRIPAKAHTNPGDAECSSTRPAGRRW